jgi:hypothetical protein
MFFTSKVGQILGFLADGTGIGSVLVQMFSLWFWDGCGGAIASLKPAVIELVHSKIFLRNA